MFNNSSLFELTARRNQKVADKTVVVGNKDNYQLSQADLTRAGVRQYIEIIEAAPRNTAAAIAFAAFSADPEDILLITPSDHIITNENAYEEAISKAVKLAGDGFLVTFGITPSKPETGYGYIEHLDDDVISFREKPSLEYATDYCQSGKFLWNSGMFCFKAGIYLEELQHFEPDIFSASRATWQNSTDGFLPETETMTIPSVSVDYAVMERSTKIKVVKAKFQWSDLGSFESIWEHWREQGEEKHFKQNNCILGSSKHVEFLGVNNLMLIETHDAILVLDKTRSQDVKRIYERLELENPDLVK